MAAFAVGALFGLASALATPPSEFNPSIVPDEIEWSIQTTGKTFAVGDVHGAFKELAVILLDRGLIDHELNWKGGNARLVLLGDIFDGGDVNKDSRLIMDLLLRLEEQAKESGGGVHVTLGNHDLQVLAGRLDKMGKAERKKFKDFAIGDYFFSKTKDAIQNSAFGEFLARQNQILKINRFVFAHAGVHPRFLRDLNLIASQVNTIVRNHIRAWRVLRHHFTVGTARPDFVNFDGPSWFGGFKLHDMEDGRKRDSSAPSAEELREWLASVGADHMVCGHRGTPDSEIVLDDPYYGDSYVSADTGIGFRDEGGRLSILEIGPKGEMKAHYPEYDKSVAKALKKTALARLVRRGESRAMSCSALFAN